MTQGSSARRGDVVGLVGMANDGLDPCGVYIGATTGQVFCSRDGGDRCELLIEHLPPINPVEYGVVD